MKVLVLGCINSVWTAHFVGEFLAKNNHEVWMLKRDNAWKNQRYAGFYKSKGVHFIDVAAEDSMIHGGRADKDYFEAACGYFLKTLKIIRSGRYDLINLHYVEIPDLMYAAALKRITGSRLMLSYWGSDLLRFGEKELHRGGKAVRRADFVTFENKDLEMKFKDTYKRARKVPSETVLFGLPVLDIIDEKLESKSKAQMRREWGIPEGKAVVAVAHNGVPEQQHIRVLEEIGKLDGICRDKIFLLLQMTYGGSEAYKRKVVAAAARTGCGYMEIRRFLTDGEVAELRIMTDVFINAQMTDAFSGSVCENLFAGTLLLNAGWLRYQEFKEHDFKFLEFGDFGEIGQLLKKALEQGIDVSGNRELMRRLRSWEACAPKWERAYRRALGKWRRPGHRIRGCIWRGG